MAVEDTRHYSEVDPEWEAFWNQIKDQVPPLEGNLHETRAHLDAAVRAALGPTPDDMIEEKTTIPARDGYQIPVTIHKPKKPAGKSPLAVLIHGGGFILGNEEGEYLNARLFAQKFGGTTVNVDYRLAPEHKFPVGPNDCWDAVKWAAANAASIGADPSAGFIVGGTSAGGNLTDVMGHLARDEGLNPPLTGLLEIIPAVTALGNPPPEFQDGYWSMDQNKDAPILPRSAADWMVKLYEPDVNSPLFNSLANPKGHKGLPPIYFQICGLDPLRDEAILYERHLREKCGVKTMIQIYQGVPHGFWLYGPHLKAAQRFMKETAEGFGWLLAQGGR